jgi:hypothetical protein
MATAVSTHRTLRLPRLALPALALAAFGLSRLLPGHGAGLYLRLAAATAVLLLPGTLAARALGRRSASAALVASLALLTPALGAVFLFRASLSLAIALYAAAGAVALLAGGRRAQAGGHDRGSWIVFAAGVLLGIALWQVAGVLSGDALFHLARTRKLSELGSLVPGSVNEFKDGSLHPGYAFPLWHAFLASVARLAGVDPSSVLLHEASPLAPLALLVTYEAGTALFRSAWLGAATVAMQVALSVLAAGHGGAWSSLALPTSAARFMLAPALFALLFEELERPSWSGRALLAAASLVLGVVHPTYLVFALLVVAGFLVARVLLVRGELRLSARALAFAAAPGCAYLLALIPLAGQTSSYNPAQSELARALDHYGSELVRHGSRYALAPEMLARSGPVSVAALLALPLALLVGRRRWAAFVLGGSLVVFALALTPLLFPHFADLVSISQARRLGGFLPFAFAAAGGLALALVPLGRLGPPLALGAGVLLQRLWPGSYGKGLGSGGAPAWVVWLSVAGAAVALVLASLRRRAWLERERDGPLALVAALLFVLPVGVATAGDWSASVTRDSFALTPGAVAALRELVPEQAVVFSDVDTSYRILAEAPVYVVVAPPSHVADTTRNRPYARVEQWKRFARHGDLAIPRRFGARWILLRQRLARRLRLSLPVAYRDSRFVLYRLPQTDAGG